MKDASKKDSGHGYWLYKDGYCYWGIGLYREFEIPLKTTEEIYKATEVPKDATPENKAKILAEGMYKRLKWYKEASEKIEAEKKAKEEAEKK